MSDRNTPEPEAQMNTAQPQEDTAVEQQMHRLSRRSFLWGGVALAAGFVGWKWLTAQPLEAGIPWPFRSAFHVNEKLTEAYFSHSPCTDVSALCGERDTGQWRVWPGR